MATPYRESYGEDDDGWTPSSHTGEPAWWDEDEDYEDYLAASVEYFRKRTVPGSVWYDFSVREWKCNCQFFEDTGKCRHIYRYRPQETVNLAEGYL